MAMSSLSEIEVPSMLPGVLDTGDPELAGSQVRTESVELDRDRLCSDIANTATIAALIGGFSLNTLASTGTPKNEFLPLAIYTSNVIATHGCTCACLMSSMLYVYANGLTDEDAVEWVQEHEWLLPIPMAKFGIGTVLYLTAVILMSWKDLNGSNEFVNYFCFLIGVMSITMIFVSATYIFRYKKNISYLSKIKED